LARGTLQLFKKVGGTPNGNLVAHFVVKNQLEGSNFKFGGTPDTYSAAALRLGITVTTD
jgi:hypothetical protein